MTPLLFDFNGTMFQDTDENEIAWKEEIFRLTKHKVTEAEFKEYLQGTINEEIIKHYLGKDTSPALVTQYALDKETIYRQLCLKRADGMALTKGLPEVLNFLKAQHIPMNIASSAMPVNIDFYFEKMHLGQWFDRSRVVCNDSNLPGKPDPAYYLEAAKKIDQAPKDCLVVEDALLGVQAAHAANVKAVAVVTSTNPASFWQKETGIAFIMKDFTTFKTWYLKNM